MGASSSCPASTATIVSFPRPAAGPIIRPSGGSGTTQRNESWKTCGSRKPLEGRDAVTAIRDEQARGLAATTFDRNVVVTASAGTGQTTLLITRLVHLLVKSPEAGPLSQVDALTLMIRAANDTQSGLREHLDRILRRDDSP